MKSGKLKDIKAGDVVIASLEGNTFQGRVIGVLRPPEVPVNTYFVEHKDAIYGAYVVGDSEIKGIRVGRSSKNGH